MADEKWRAIRHLIHELTSDNRKAEFFQLVRLIERARCSRELLPPRGRLKQPTGTSRQLSDEAVRFHAQISARFLSDSTGPLEQAYRDVNDDPTSIETSFASAAGAQGALPSHYTTLILQRLREGDPAFRDYLDLFHHRIVSALVRSWEKHRPHSLLEIDQVLAGEPDDAAATDVFSSSVSAIAGRRRYDAPTEFDKDIVLFYSGIFSDCRRPATSLAAMLEDYLGVHVAVEQFHPIRIRVPSDHRWRLPGGHRKDQTGHMLGSGLLLGETVEVVQTSFLVLVGPLGLGDFRDYLPEGHCFAPLSQLIRYYAGFEFEISIRLLLNADEAPEFRLGGRDSPGVRLGWETWISSRPASAVLDDVQFKIGA